MRKKQGNFSKQVFAGKIKDELNMILRRDMNDRRFSMMSITRVELNDDYSKAEVYWDTFDPGIRGDLMAAVSGVRSRLRSILAKQLNVRHTPDLELIYDSQFEDEKRIESLLSTDSVGE